MIGPRRAAGQGRRVLTVPARRATSRRIGRVRAYRAGAWEPSQVHAHAAMMAEAKGKSLNQWAAEVLANAS